MKTLYVLYELYFSTECRHFMGLFMTEWCDDCFQSSLSSLTQSGAVHKLRQHNIGGWGQKCGISDDGQVEKIAGMGEEGVKNSEKSADLLYG